MTIPFQRLNTHYGIHFYALLLLSDIEWEVAYSTLCTETKKGFVGKKTVHHLHVARLTLQQVQSLTHMLHTQTTQAHIDRVRER